MKYNYSNIEDKEFENLSRDLINRALGIDLRTFSKGADGGIDGLYVEENSRTILQAKHYLNSGTLKLISSLKKIEKLKLKSLNCNRYILSTSCSLTPKNLEEIKNIFTPYIRSEQDIYSLEKLDELLDTHKDILCRYPNLYFDYSILQNILGKNLYKKNEERIRLIENNMKKFVWSEQYNNAFEKLKNNNILVITGIPGIGKTTLANLICMNYLLQGYSLIVADSNKIFEFEQIIDENRNTIVFLDDFLGGNILEYFAENKNPGNDIIEFIEKIKRNSNVKLIITSRTHIINEANLLSEKFGRLHLENPKRNNIICLENYSKYEKAKIFFNHLKAISLSSNQKENILENENYKKIINHKNYSPRIIEYITNNDIESEEKEKNYIKYMVENLNNAEELWKIPFKKLKESEKDILYYVFACNSKVEVDFLKEYFIEEIKEENNSLEEILKILEGSFLKFLKLNEIVYIDFINPSLRDFFIKRGQEDIKKILKIVKTTSEISIIKNLLFLLDFDIYIIKALIEDNCLKRFSLKEQNEISLIILKNFKKDKKNSIYIKIKEKVINILEIEKDIYNLLTLKRLNIFDENEEINIDRIILNIFDEEQEDIFYKNYIEISEIDILVKILKKHNKLDFYLKMLQDEIKEEIEIFIKEYDYSYDIDEAVDLEVEFTEEDTIKESIFIDIDFYVNKIYRECSFEMEKEIYEEGIIKNIIREKLDEIDFEEIYFKEKSKKTSNYIEPQNTQKIYNEEKMIESLFKNL